MKRTGFTVFSICRCISNYDAKIRKQLLSNKCYVTNVILFLSQKAYAALGIQKDATESQIKARWRNLMRVNHPDKVESKGVAAVESATLKCQELNKAYEKIKSSRGMK